MALSDDQFGQDSNTGISYWKKHDPKWNVTEYEAIDRQGTAYGTGSDRGHDTRHPMAVLHISNGKWENHFHARTSGEYEELVPRSHIFPETGEKEARYYNFHGQGTLFHSKPAQIGLMRAHPTVGMRVAAMNLAGMAIQDANRAGHEVVPDDSLSVHSSPLAQLGVQTGVLKQNSYNPTSEKTNGMSLDPHYEYVWHPAGGPKASVATLNESEGFTEIPRSEVMAGKQFILDARKKAKNPQATSTDGPSSPWTDPRSEAHREWKASAPRPVDPAQGEQLKLNL